MKRASQKNELKILRACIKTFVGIWVAAGLIAIGIVYYAMLNPDKRLISAFEKISPAGSTAVHHRENATVMVTHPKRGMEYYFKVKKITPDQYIVNGFYTEGVETSQESGIKLQVFTPGDTIKLAPE